VWHSSADKEVVIDNRCTSTSAYSSFDEDLLGGRRLLNCSTPRRNGSLFKSELSNGSFKYSEDKLSTTASNSIEIFAEDTCPDSVHDLPGLAYLGLQVIEKMHLQRPHQETVEVSREAKASVNASVSTTKHPDIVCLTRQVIKSMIQLQCSIELCQSSYEYLQIQQQSQPQPQPRQCTQRVAAASSPTSKRCHKQTSQNYRGMSFPFMFYMPLTHLFFS
jgi:hypothetical protein